MPFNTFNSDQVCDKKTVTILCVKHLDPTSTDYVLDKNAVFLFGLVKSVNRLVQSEVSRKSNMFEEKENQRDKPSGKKNPFHGQKVKTICTHCMYYKFKSKKAMEAHKKECVRNRASLKVYPQVDDLGNAPRDRKNVLRYKAVLKRL